MNSLVNDIPLSTKDIHQNETWQETNAIEVEDASFVEYTSFVQKKIWILIKCWRKVKW